LGRGLGSTDVPGRDAVVDFYDLLGVAPTATPEQIKSAYRALSKTAHPDAGGNSGMFRLLQQAHQTLSDPAKRAQYDRSQTAQTPPPPPPPRPDPPRPDPGPASDLWGDQSGPSARGPRYDPRTGEWLPPEGVSQEHWAQAMADAHHGISATERLSWWLESHAGLGANHSRALAPAALYGAGAGVAMAVRCELAAAVIPARYELVHPSWWWIAPVVLLVGLVGIPLSRGLAMRSPWTRVRLLGGSWLAIAAGEYVVFGAMLAVMLFLMARFILAIERR
jgi:hypothetical protein